LIWPVIESQTFGMIYSVNEIQDSGNHKQG